MIRYAVTILLVTLLAGCASPSVTPPKDSKLAVVSVLGSDLSLRQVGITVFGNSAKVINVSSWNVDEHVAESLRSGLNAAGFGTTAMDPGWKSALGAISFFPFLSSYSFAGGAEGVQRAARAAKVDYLIIVAAAPSSFGDPFFGTNQDISGYGVYQRRGRGNIDFAHVAVILVDGKTGEVLDGRNGAESTLRSDDLWIDVDAALLLPSTLGEPREAFLSTIDAAVQKALGHMKLLSAR